MASPSTLSGILEKTLVDRSSDSVKLVLNREVRIGYPSRMKRLQRIALMPYRMFRYQRTGLWLGVGLLALGLWLNWVYSPRSIHSEVVKVVRSEQQVLVGRVYTPSHGVPAPYPTLMLWHGVSSTKETLTPLAIALARQGIAVATFDAGGFGESYPRTYSEAENLTDAQAIAAYVFAHPEQFNAVQIGVGGHSMGGATALFLANEESRIKTTIVLGMSADINRILPPNLLMGIGLYEQFHSPAAMRLMLQQGTDPLAKAFQTYGDFKRGTARRLVISPTSDHLMAPFDPTLIHETVAWAKQAFDLNESSPKLPKFMASGGMVSQFFLLLGSIFSSSYWLRRSARPRQRRRWFAMGLIAAVLLILTLGMSGQLSGLLTTQLIIGLAILLPFGNYALCYPTQLTPMLQIAGLYGVLIGLAYGIAAVGLRGFEFMAQPSWILGLPQFLLQMPIALLYSRLQEWRAMLFPVYGEGVVPSWGLLFLFLPEVIRPGVVLHGLTQLAIWVARWLRQPLQFQWMVMAGRSLQLLAILTIMLLGILYWQGQQGALSVEAVATVSKLLLQTGLLPALLVVAAMRSPYWQAIERRFWQS